MKKLFIKIFIFLFLINNSFAVNLSQALRDAYKKNPILNAERENINISKQNINISRSELLPSVTLSGSKSDEDTKKLTNRDKIATTTSDSNPEVRTVLIEQEIFQGLGGVADLKKNKLGLNLAKAKLLKVEQETLYQAVEAYTGLILANKKFEINESNVILLERQVETDQARLENGQISLADLSQSESSLAGANAKFIEAKNNVITSKLNYENVIGPIVDSNDLEKEIDVNFLLPDTLDKLNQISNQKNPDLIIAKLQLEQSEQDVKIARSELSPSAKLSFESSKTDNFSSTYYEKDKEILKATVTWPIYSGGKNTSKLKKNKNIKNQKKLLLDNAMKLNSTNIATAWSNYQASKSLLDSVISQVKAAEIANEGITLEYESGGAGRSTLDVIQSNSMLLESRINLANSERNFILSRYKLLQSIGLLNLGYLGLNN